MINAVKSSTGIFTIQVSLSPAQTLKGNVGKKVYCSNFKNHFLASHSPHFLTLTL
nr:MAG TPA: hypothetical protein [Caudoviricetes sp.]